MFLCDTCHDPQNHLPYFRSQGKCEGCGRTASCIDCHRASCEPSGKTPHCCETLGPPTLRKR
jgi:hypothetical protein